MEYKFNIGDMVEVPIQLENGCVIRAEGVIIDRGSYLALRRPIYLIERTDGLGTILETREDCISLIYASNDVNVVAIDLERILLQDTRL